MNISRSKILRQTSNFFFIFALLMITFSLTEIILRKYEVLEITLPYEFLWLIALSAFLLISAIRKERKRFFTVLILGLMNFILFVYVLMTTTIFIEKPLGNSRYFLTANMHSYQIKKQNCCYKKVIARKSSDLFFTPNMKIGIVPYFEARLLSENSEVMVLQIKTSSGEQSVKDTIRKFNN